MIHSLTTIQRAEKIVMREIGGETLLIPIHQTGHDIQKIFALNETARHIWDKLKSPQSIQALTAMLQSEFEGETREIESHITELVDDLSALGLIQCMEE